MRNAYIDTLYQLAKKNNSIMALTADTGIFIFDKFIKAFPERFINVGIAEANLIGVASGLALSGKIPFCYAITSFMPIKCIEQIKIDVCSQNLNVKIVSVGSGFAYGPHGPTHHSLEDIGIMRTLPDITIICPSDPLEARKATEAASRLKGPVYIRLGKNNEPNVYEKDYDFKIGKAVLLKKGSKVTLISTGVCVFYALSAARLLEKEGISCAVLNMHTIKPLDHEAIIESAKTSFIVTIEEHSIIGGLGSAVSEVLCTSDIKKTPKVLNLGIRDIFIKKCREYNILQDFYGLSTNGIISSVKRFIRN